MMKQAILILVVLICCAPIAEVRAQSTTTPAIPLSRVRVGTAATLASPATIQDPVAAPTVYVDPETGAVISTAVPTATTPTATNVVTPRTRLQAINEMEIDRRPSSVLQEWSDLPSDDPRTERAPSPLSAEVGALRWWLMMGEWEKVANYIDSLNSSEASSVYRTILTKLRQPPSNNRVATNPAGQAFVEQNLLSPDDVWQLLLASPTPIDETTLQLLSSLLALSFSVGNQPDSFVNHLEEYTTSDAPDEKLISQRQAAQLLSLAGQPLQLQRFLPTPDEAIANDDAEALNLLTVYYLARHAAEPNEEDLREAWLLTQAVLASQNADGESQKRALAQAVDLSPRVSEELGEQWLNESFSAEPERGMRILATVGALTSRGLSANPTNPDERAQNWKLLTTAVEAMLAHSPELSREWQETLNMLAISWLQEADLAHRLDLASSRGPIMQYDSYGNPYFLDEARMMAMQQSRQNQPRPIPVAELLPLRPSADWLDRIDGSLQPKFAEWLAKLFLKVNEPENAFPHIERLAIEQPLIATELVNEFLRVWAQNHDPNSARRLTSPIFRIYGFSQRAEGIPLTRSKQERNLEELTEWVKRLRALPVGDDFDRRLLVRAFTICHSSAEVYDIESIRRVFGELETLEPEMLAGLVQQMRTNLAGLWREPDVQKQAKTNRHKKDIEAEVLRGYLVANNVLQDGIKQYGEDWSLLTARAALMHDQVNYEHEVAKSSTFAEKRLAALKEFQKAAEAYAQQLDEIKSEQQSVEVYLLWFHASLGACEVNQLDADKLAVLSEPPRIREAIESLPGEAAERHMALFANALFTELQSVNPTVKFRYLKQGFAIVGDHPQAVEAKKVFDYYDDLVTEIQLHAVVDGSTNVGADEPFGVFINLRHTREIERESGGFSRYLQNQNNVQYAYNYGRPTENYRDKFEDSVRDSLREHFDVLSVTFQSEDVSSKADDEYGWRVTPYAYLLVKARGPQVDRIPPIRLDLDFLDTSGYVILPIESPMVPIDAGIADDRPSDVLNVTQTLDERQSDKGRLILEIKATSHGLTPDLEDLVTLDAEGFEIASIDDQGVSVSRFDPESEATEILCERLWTVTFTGRTDLETLPKEFTFVEPKASVREVVYQRYDDADLATVDRTIPLESSYGKRDRTWWWIAGGCALIGLCGLIGIVVITRRNRQHAPIDHLHLPDPLTPFTVIAVLREIHQTNGLAPQQKDELEADIHRLESAYFAPQATQDADFKRLAETWLKRVKR